MEQSIQAICGKSIHFFYLCCRPEHIPVSCIMFLLQNANLCNTCDRFSKSTCPFWRENVNRFFDRFALCILGVFLWRQNDFFNLDHLWLIQFKEHQLIIAVLHELPTEPITQVFIPLHDVK